jgi:hypothetical protein
MRQVAASSSSSLPHATQPHDYEPQKLEQPFKKRKSCGQPADERAQLIQEISQLEQV